MASPSPDRRARHPNDRSPKVQGAASRFGSVRGPLVYASMALLVAVVVLLAACAGPLRPLLYEWTGEENLWEQIKGTVALGYLRITTDEPETEPYVPIAHAGICPYGVNTFLEQEVEAEKVERTLSMVAEAGFCWIRQEFPWEDIEISAKGDYWDHKWGVSAWAKYDRLVEAAERHGVEIIARLDNPPAWSRSHGDEPGWGFAPPDDYADFGDFVYAVISRYRGRIRYYQIWNEPNIYPEWGPQGADPEAYVELLKVAYTRAKEADPDCVILSAGLAQTLEMGPQNLSDLVYLERMYQAAAKDYFDILGAQAYGLWNGPQDQRLSPDRTNFARVILLRDIMVRYGDSGKAIWVTEVGWNAAPADLGLFPYGRVTESKQAEYTVAAYRRAQKEWPWMGVMNYWFLRRPSDAEIGQPWYYFRMLEPDFTPLPVYQAMAQLASSPPVIGLGYHQEDHWALQYKGDWRFVREANAVLGGVAIGEEGAEASFSFQGNFLYLVLQDKDQASRLQVEVDGNIVGLQPLQGVYAGEAVFAIDARLRDGQHTAKLDVVEGTVGLDGLVVAMQDNHDEVLLGAVGVAIILALALWLLPRSAGHGSD